MPVPLFTGSGVLPPFVGSPAGPGGSPYLATLQEIATRLGMTPERRTILRGLIRYRAELRKNGIAAGFQWLDGSFVEDKAIPGDVDVVTFASPPAALTPAIRDLFSPPKTKATFKCDAYFVDLKANPEAIITWTTYWYRVFSHRRVTSEWKGMLVSRLEDANDDAMSVALLDKLDGKP